MCYLIYCFDLWYMLSLKSDLNRHTVLDISRRFIFLFHGLNSEKPDTMCQLSYYVDCVCIQSLKSKFNQTHCVSCFTNIDSVFLHDLTSEKTDTMCQLIYCVDLGYFWSLQSDLNIHTVLYISLIFIWVVSKLYQCKNNTLCVS